MHSKVNEKNSGPPNKFAVLCIHCNVKKRKLGHDFLVLSRYQYLTASPVRCLVCDEVIDFHPNLTI